MKQIGISNIGRWMCVVVAIALCTSSGELYAKRRSRRNAQARSRFLRARSSALPPARESARNIAEPARSKFGKDLQSQLDSLLGSGWLKRSINGVLVLDRSTGETLYEYASDRQLNPASNMKLVSTAAALTAMGPNYQFATELRGSRPNSEGIIAGDVVLVGSSDPTLARENLAELAWSLREAGVTKIKGRLVSDSTKGASLIRPSLTLRIVGASANKQNARVKVLDELADLIVINSKVITQNRGRSNVSVSVRKDDDKLHLEVRGRVRKNQVLFQRKTIDPVFLTLGVLHHYLKIAGITVEDGFETQEASTENMAVLATFRSHSLGLLTAKINKPSNNFLADMLATRLGAHQYQGNLDLSRGVDAMNQYLEQIGVSSGHRIDNGSGLSYTNRLSARQVFEVMQHAANDFSIGPEFLTSLSVAGHDGTLRSRYRQNQADGLMRGKTGTLNGVAALSGFVGHNPERTIAFAILTNGFRARKINEVRDAHRQIVMKLLHYINAQSVDGNDANAEQSQGSYQSSVVE